jgi:hypothetical protein
MRRLFLALFGLALLLAVGSVFVASEAPDGLERVAEDLGFHHEPETPSPQLGPLPDYQTPGLSGPASGIVAGLVGVLAMLGLGLGLGRLLRRRPAP